MAITTAAELIQTLSELRLLDAAQLDKLQRAVQGHAPEPRAVARELLKHGWLTAFQVNQVMQGKGAELLLGPYVLLERLGEGGMGHVFKARHQLMNRAVAIKIIRKELLTSGNAVERFHREIRLAAQLDHPNLVRAHDAAQMGDTHFLVMEYAEGTDLQRLVQKSGPLPVAQACIYVRQAALGLQHAWERGLVHRDVKPSNLQLTGQGSMVKILDMGLARSQESDEGAGVGAGLTQARTIMGTPDYIAPEQIADPRTVDVRADIYSLGCTFYFLLAGRPPFGEGSWEEKLVAHRKQEPPAIEQVRPEVPPALGAVLRKMMAKRPEDRYSAPAALADALTPFCGMTAAAPFVTAAAGAPGSGVVVGQGRTPVPAGSLVNAAGTPEAGWSLGVEATRCPPPLPATGISTPAVFAEPTMLVTGQPSGDQPPPAPTLPAPEGMDPALRKRIWMLLGGGGGLVVVGLVLLLILAWPKSGGGDKGSGGQEPVAARSTEARKEPSRTDPSLLIDEDFVSAARDVKLPDGWEGDDFKAVVEKDRPCLISTAASGHRFVTLPHPLPLKGNFTIWGRYLLGSSPFDRHLTVRLDSEKNQARLNVVVDARGWANIDGEMKFSASRYTPSDDTYFRLTRKGNEITVLLDDHLVAQKRLDKVPEYDTVQIGLTAGGGAVQGRRPADKTGGKPPQVARLYFLKISLLPP